MVKRPKKSSIGTEQKINIRKTLIRIIALTTGATMLGAIILGVLVKKRW